MAPLCGEPLAARVFIDLVRSTLTPNSYTKSAGKAAFKSHPIRGDDAFRRRGEAGAWRRDFSLLDRIAFARGGGEMLIELGYEESGLWWLSKCRQGLRFPGS